MKIQHDQELVHEEAEEPADCGEVGGPDVVDMFGSEYTRRVTGPGRRAGRPWRSPKKVPGTGLQIYEGGQNSAQKGKKVPGTGLQIYEGGQNSASACQAPLT